MILMFRFGNGFNPLWINTALKLGVCGLICGSGFNPLWINTALKRGTAEQNRDYVSIPYGLTLLSNCLSVLDDRQGFQSPMD